MSSNTLSNDSILETEQMFLRYQRETDIPFLIYLWTDSDMTRFTGGPRNRDFLLEEFSRVAANPREEEYDLWILEEKKTQKLIGQAGFIPKTVEGEMFIEINYYISREEWGKGYGTEIAQALKEYVFKSKKQKNMIAIIDLSNESSKKVAEHIGMKYWKFELREKGEKLIYKIENEET